MTHKEDAKDKLRRVLEHVNLYHPGKYSEKFSHAYNWDFDSSDAILKMSIKQKGIFSAPCAEVNYFYLSTRGGYSININALNDEGKSIEHIIKEGLKKEGLEN